MSICFFFRFTFAFYLQRRFLFYNQNKRRKLQLRLFSLFFSPRKGAVKKQIFHCSFLDETATCFNFIPMSGQWSNNESTSFFYSRFMDFRFKNTNYLIVTWFLLVRSFPSCGSYLSFFLLSSGSRINLSLDMAPVFLRTITKHRTLITLRKEWFFVYMENYQDAVPSSRVSAATKLLRITKKILITVSLNKIIFSLFPANKVASIFANLRQRKKLWEKKRF